MSVVLIGSGKMAKEYAKALTSIGEDITVIGRGNKSASAFEEDTGIPVIIGGIEAYFTRKSNYEKAIITTGIENLAEITAHLLNNGCSQILVEKPAALNLNEIQGLNALANLKRAEVFVAYNRRFYTATQKARKIITEDGGVTSFHFEFTEWTHTFNLSKNKPEVWEKWFLANSTHVSDLAFHLGGTPKEIKSFIAGQKNLPWHPSGSVFSGAGKTKDNVPFTYLANWEAPGRWGVELLTKKHRLYLKPMEKLAVQKIGSVKIEELDLDYSIDKNFKPGLLSQVSAFLKGTEKEILCRLNHQMELFPFYYQMAGYR